jgi:hypothetical protein
LAPGLSGTLKDCVYMKFSLGFAGSVSGLQLADPVHHFC